MPRRPRLATGGMVFHVLNRASGKRRIFEGASDYVAFEQAFREANDRIPIRCATYCVMPTHWHLVLWPERDGELSKFMHWLTVTHTQRWHAFHRTSGTGPLYQGRFKAIPVQTDDHFLRLVRYVERNPVRARLVDAAQDWQWGGLWRRCNDCDLELQDPWPIPAPANWIDIVNRPQTDAELKAIRRVIAKGIPFGDESWTEDVAERLGLTAGFRERGRPPTKKDSRPLSAEMTPDPFF